MPSTDPVVSPMTAQNTPATPGVAADWLVCPPGSALVLYLLPEGRIDFRTLCMTLASLWQQDQDGPKGVFLQPITRLRGQEKQRSRPHESG